MGKGGRFDVAVSFDERLGYVGTLPELRSPVTALSLGGLRRCIEIGAGAAASRLIPVFAQAFAAAAIREHGVRLLLLRDGW